MNIYIDLSLGWWIVLVGVVGDEGDVFLDLFSLFLPFFYIKHGFLGLNSLHYFLVLPDDFGELFFAVWFIQSFLLGPITETRVGLQGLFFTTILTNIFYFGEQRVILFGDFSVTELFNCKFFRPLVQEHIVLGLLFTKITLHTFQFFLMDPPWSLQILVEADPVIVWNGSKHSFSTVIWAGCLFIYYGIRKLEY